jgi:hypothetical protein
MAGDVDTARAEAERSDAAGAEMGAADAARRRIACWEVGRGAGDRPTVHWQTDDEGQTVTAQPHTIARLQRGQLLAAAGTRMQGPLPAAAPPPPPPPRLSFPIALEQARTLQQHTQQQHSQSQHSQPARATASGSIGLGWCSERDSGARGAHLSAKTLGEDLEAGRWAGGAAPNAPSAHATATGRSTNGDAAASRRSEREPHELAASSLSTAQPSASATAGLHLPPVAEIWSPLRDRLATTFTSLSSAVTGTGTAPGGGTLRAGRPTRSSRALTPLF